MTPQLERLASIPDAFAANGVPLLEFDRKPLDRNPLRGFVLGWTDKLTLIQVVCGDMFQLNGYAVIRNSDVRRWKAILNDDFLAKASRLQKLWPTKPATVTIANMKSAVSSAGMAFPLVTIHREGISRNVCHVGRHLRTTQRATTIVSISSQAEWEEQESYHLREITLLGFGGSYEKLLSELAKATPHRG